MFNSHTIIHSLEENQHVFAALLNGIHQDEYNFRPAPGKWNILEIVCHLHDEEREDFRARVKLVLEDPTVPFPKIDPQAWVSERKYSEQYYITAMQNFLAERKASIEWLRSLEAPKWENAYQHPKVGPVRAQFLLCNWLAHDYLHLRQLNANRYQYLLQTAGEKLDYAGDW